jgi:hypothetical protein
MRLVSYRACAEIQSNNHESGKGNQTGEEKDPSSPIIGRGPRLSASKALMPDYNNSAK